MNRKLIGILLFACLIAPAAVTYLIIENHKYQVKKEIKWKFIAAMNHEELVQLKFTSEQKQTELNWEHSKEFEYKGEMYDVVKAEEHGDTTYYWCWWDHEETQLNQKLNELVAIALGNNPTNQENSTRLFKFFESMYYTDVADMKAPAFQETDIAFSTTPNFYQSIPGSHHAPPPEVA